MFRKHALFSPTLGPKSWGTAADLKKTFQLTPSAGLRLWHSRRTRQRYGKDTIFSPVITIHEFTYIQICFKPFINCCKSSSLNPPFLVLFMTVFLQMRSYFLFHTHLKHSFCRRSVNPSGWFGRSIHERKQLDKMIDFKTAILPNGVIDLFIQILNSIFYFRKLITIIDLSHSQLNLQ